MEPQSILQLLTNWGAVPVSLAVLTLGVALIVAVIKRHDVEFSLTFWGRSLTIIIQASNDECENHVEGETSHE